jgi:hypothetical protein
MVGWCREPGVEYFAGERGAVDGAEGCDDADSECASASTMVVRTWDPPANISEAP